jgi:hypothetical protein
MGDLSLQTMGRYHPATSALKNEKSISEINHQPSKINMSLER